MILALTGVPLVIVSIIAFILILGIIIIIHEGGHFFFARRAGILCHEFSIGMGPAIYKKKFKETTFCIRAIPIGGYVSMAGEEISSELIKIGDKIGLNLLEGKASEIIVDENLEAQLQGEVIDLDLYGKDGNPLYVTINDGLQDHYVEVLRDAYYILKKGDRLQITPYDRSFESKSLWQRFLTVFAGPFMNFILAIVLYLIVSFATGVPNYNSTTIGSVSLGNSSLVVENGEETTTLLLPGDEIKSINHTEVKSWNDVNHELTKLLEQNKTTATLSILRDGNPMTVEVECYTNIVSLGLTNIQVEKKEFPAEVTKGLRVGNLALRYLDDSKKGDYPLSYGDIITKLKVDKVNSNGNVEEGTPIEIESWGQLVEIFKAADVVNVHFEYYSYEKKGIVSLEDSATLQTYGNEVLNNQRIDKIQVKIGISPSMHFDFFGCIGTAFVHPKN